MNYILTFGSTGSSELSKWVHEKYEKWYQSEEGGNGKMWRQDHSGKVNGVLTMYEWVDSIKEKWIIEYKNAILDHWKTL